MFQNRFIGAQERGVWVYVTTPEEYILIEDTAHIWWANTKSGIYGQGLRRTREDPYKPVRTGLLGQLAFSHLTNTPLDLAYREGGDIYDAIFNRYTVDVKCAMRNYGRGLVYHQSSNGVLIPLDKDVYVFGYVAADSNTEKLREATIILMGYLMQDEVRNCPIKRGIRGNHWNYEIEFSVTHPIQEFLSLEKIG